MSDVKRQMTPEQIREAVKEHRRLRWIRLKQRDEQDYADQDILDAIRDQCDHKAKTYHPEGYSSSWHSCNDCGKEF